MAYSTGIHIPTGDLRNEIRACRVPQFRSAEVAWSRRTALSGRPGEGVGLSAQRVRRLNDSLAEHTAAPGFHVSLVGPDPDNPKIGSLMGSGTLVRVDDHVGVLSASHVFAEKGIEGNRFGRGGLAVLSNLGEGQAPGGLVSTEAIQLCGGVAHLPHREPAAVGLPDLAFFILNDPVVVEKYRPRAFPFEEASCCVAGDELLVGNWFITGARGERSDRGRLYAELARAGFIDRVYERQSMSFLSTFVDPADAPRTHRRDWGGTSGGGVWNQRLTPVGRDKLRLGGALSRDDLGELRLVGVPFFHSATPPAGPVDPREAFGGELIAHHLTPEFVRGIRAGVLTQADDAYRRFTSQP